MKYTNKKGYRFSKLSLGTVQLGMPYGISNVDGKPPEAIARNILDVAMDSGITTFDTSESYGSAEDVIGKYITTHGHTLPTVVTKFKLGINSNYSTTLVREEIYQSVESSLRRLNLKKIPVYLFHKDPRQEMQNLIQPLSIVLGELKDKGLIDIGGISAYGPEDVDFVLDHDIFEAVQIPLNIFDQRLVNNGRLAQLGTKNKIVFARSIFLQGLFFMSTAELPKTLHSAKPYLDRLRQIANESSLTVPQLCFSFVKELSPVTSIVFGAVSPEQVRENVAWSEAPVLHPNIVTSIREAFEDVPDFIITPGRWMTQEAGSRR